MDADSTIHSDNKEQLQLEEGHDSCRVDFTEIIPLARDMDDSCTTHCVSEDCYCSEVREVDLTDLKQEPDDVCILFFILRGSVITCAVKVPTIGFARK